NPAGHATLADGWPSSGVTVQSTGQASSSSIRFTMIDSIAPVVIEKDSRRIVEVKVAGRRRDSHAHRGLEADGVRSARDQPVVALEDGEGAGAVVAPKDDAVERPPGRVGNRAGALGDDAELVPVERAVPLAAADDAELAGVVGGQGPHLVPLGVGRDLADQPA